MQYCESTDNGQTWSNWSNITNSNYQTFRMPGSTETISIDNLKESTEINYTYYYYVILYEITDMNIANIITKGTGENDITQWLASCEISCGNVTSFGVRNVYYDGYDCAVSASQLYYTNGESYSESCAIRPVVSLQSNIQLEGNSEDGWNIK